MYLAYLDARKESGLTGESMVELLEMRLDALVLRAGFARTILQSRQAVSHRHVLVDGKLVDRPSFRVLPGQTIQIKRSEERRVGKEWRERRGATRKEESERN